MLKKKTPMKNSVELQNNIHLIYGLIERIDSRVEKIDSKIDKIKETQSEQGVVQAQNTIILRQHEQRSTKLEDWVSKIHGAHVSMEDKINSFGFEISDIKKSELSVTNHIHKINSYLGIFKSVPVMLKFSLLLLAFVSGVYGLFEFFYKVY